MFRISTVFVLFSILSQVIPWNNMAHADKSSVDILKYPSGDFANIEENAVKRGNGSSRTDTIINTGKNDLEDTSLLRENYDFTSNDTCQPLAFELLGINYEYEDNYRLSYNVSKDIEVDIDDLIYISNETGEEFFARLDSTDIVGKSFVFSMDHLLQNQSYTVVLNLTSTKNSECYYMKSFNFIAPAKCHPVLTVANISQDVGNIYKVKYAISNNKAVSIVQMDCVSNETGEEFDVGLKHIDYVDKTFFISTDLMPQEVYRFIITYSYNNGACQYDSFLDFSTPVECQPINLKLKNVTFESENVYRVQYDTTDTNTSVEIVDLKYVSRSTREEITIDKIKFMNNTKKSFLISMKNLLQNESYTLIATYSFNDGLCMNSSALDFFVPAKKPNIFYLFACLVLIVFLLYTCSLVYNGQIMKIKLAVQQVKNVLFPRYGDCQVTKSELNLVFPNCYTRQEINLLYTSVEQEMVQLHDSYEFPREKIIISKVIGEGEFGKVFYAKAHGLFGYPGYTMVAVKQMKSDPTREAQTDFLAEINMLKRIGKHTNIVRMLACVTESQPYMIIMELVRTGNLQDYLLELRKIWNSKSFNFSDRKINDSYIQPDNEFDIQAVSSDVVQHPDYIDADDLLVFMPDQKTPLLEDVTRPPLPVLDHKELQCFAFQIANGMAHLEKIGVTHRDLAARNILITKNKLLKITDFGMSRLGPYVNRNTTRKIPLRWWSIEAIEELKADNKSDVWSFGVVLWEIGTLGAFPYGDMLCNRIIHFLKSGGRLGRPEICTDELYDLMLRCWRERSQDRPSFEELVKLLDAKKRTVYLEFRKINPGYIFPEPCVE